MNAASFIAVITGVASAVAAGFAAWTALLMRQQMRYSAGAEVMDRFDRLNDHLCRSFGPPDDGLDVNVRQQAIELLALLERAFVAHNSGVLDLDQWSPMMLGLGYWMRRSELRVACTSLLAYDEAWQPGFAAFAQEELARPATRQELLGVKVNGLDGVAPQASPLRD